MKRRDYKYRVLYCGGLEVGVTSFSNLPVPRSPRLFEQLLFNEAILSLSSLLVDSARLVNSDLKFALLE